MKITQKQWKVNSGWQPAMNAADQNAQLVFVFGSTALLKEKERIDEIKKACPGAYVMGCSTAGEILATHVTDETIAVTAVHFEHTGIQGI